MFENFYQQVWDNVTYQGDRAFKNAKQVVARTARREAGQLFKWMADQIIKPLNTVPSDLWSYQSGWKSLSTKTSAKSKTSYFQKKVKQYGNQAFFLGLPRDQERHGGTLEEALRTVDPTTVFGVDEEEEQQHINPMVSMSFRSMKDRLTYKITAHIYPNIPENAGNFELAEMVAAAVGDETILYRLVNPRGPERPFLYPAMLYFINDRVKRKIEDALVQEGFIVRN